MFLDSASAVQRAWPPAVPPLGSFSCSTTANVLQLYLLVQRLLMNCQCMAALLSQSTPAAGSTSATILLMPPVNVPGTGFVSVSNCCPTSRMRAFADSRSATNCFNTFLRSSATEICSRTVGPSSGNNAPFDAQLCSHKVRHFGALVGTFMCLCRVGGKVLQVPGIESVVGTGIAAHLLQCVLSSHFLEYLLLQHSLQDCLLLTLQLHGSCREHAWRRTDLT